MSPLTSHLSPLTRLRWLLAWFPALLILAMMLPLLVPVPFEDSWVFVQQYRGWCAGDYGWREFMAPHNNHPSAPGKLIYFAVLHLARGDVALLPLLAWLMSLGIAVSVFTTARPLWRDHPRRGAIAMLCVNLTVFTAAAGHAWVWDFVFQNFIPGACFAVGLALLSAQTRRWPHVATAALLSLIGTFSFGSGFLGGLLLTPLLLIGNGSQPLHRRCAGAALWLVVVLASAWIALEGFGDATHTGGEGSRIGSLLAEPLLLARFVLMLLGYALGNGTSLDPMHLCPLMGLGVAAVFTVCTARLMQRRADRVLLQAALPWLLMALYGLGNAALITYGRLRFSLIAAMAPRYVVFTLFFTLGTLLLALAVAKHEPVAGWFGKLMRQLSGPLLGFFLAAQAFNWVWGHQQMRRDHERMRQDAALLSFSNVLPAEANVLWQLHADKDEVARLAKFLHERDALRGVTFVPSDRMAAFRKAPELSSKWAWFDEPVRKDSSLQLRGVCGLSKDLVSLPDAIVISAQMPDGEERIVALVRPEIPFDFYEHEWLRRLHLDHYFGWSREIPLSLLPEGRITLRAHAFDAAAKRLRALHGAHELDLPPR